MLFAVIPLRNALPGAPPFGAWVDIAAVLWVTVALGLAMVIYIGCWWRHTQARGRQADLTELHGHVGGCLVFDCSTSPEALRAAMRLRRPEGIAECPVLTIGLSSWICSAGMYAA